MAMIRRSLHLPPAGSETFFLWGPRQTGKSTLLRRVYPDSLWIDLLQSEVFRRYLNHPEQLREQLAGAAGKPFVVIDEVQKLPQILDEVHWLHENRGIRFGLCGSSARKIQRAAQPQGRTPPTSAADRRLPGRYRSDHRRRHRNPAGIRFCGNAPAGSVAGVTNDGPTSTHRRRIQFGRGSTRHPAPG